MVNTRRSGKAPEGREEDAPHVEVVVEQESQPSMHRVGESEVGANRTPVTMADLQTIIEQLKGVVAGEVHRIIGDRERSGGDRVSEARSDEKTRGGGTRVEKSSTGGCSDARARPDENYGCSFKTFMACKPNMYTGSSDPKVTMRWIRETERVIGSSKCKKTDMVLYASQLLKGDAMVWWDIVYETLGREVIERMSWDEFTARLRKKFCPDRDLEKMHEKFVTLRKGDMSVEEYSREFTGLLPFVAKTYSEERLRVVRYASGLPWDYQLEVKRAVTLDEAISAARGVEEVNEARVAERAYVGDKRNAESGSGTVKKGKFMSNSSRQGSVASRRRYGENRTVEGRGEPKICHDCGKTGHLARDCRSKPMAEVECYSCHEKGHYSHVCPKKETGSLVSAAQKKAEPAKVKGRSFQLTREEARDGASGSGAKD